MLCNALLLSMCICCIVHTYQIYLQPNKSCLVWKWSSTTISSSLTNFNNYYVVATSDDYYLDRKTWLLIYIFFSCLFLSLSLPLTLAHRSTSIRQYNKIIISRSWIVGPFHLFHFIFIFLMLANLVFRSFMDWFFNRWRDMNVCTLCWKSIHALSNVYRYFVPLLISFFLF